MYFFLNTKFCLNRKRQNWWMQLIFTAGVSKVIRTRSFTLRHWFKRWALSCICVPKHSFAAVDLVNDASFATFLMNATCERLRGQIHFPPYGAQIQSPPPRVIRSHGGNVMTSVPGPRPRGELLSEMFLRAAALRLEQSACLTRLSWLR